jgi:lysophospholipase
MHGALRSDGTGAEVALVTTETAHFAHPGAVHTLVTADGVRLRAAIWRGPEPKATVLIVQGRAEFIEKYVEVINDFMARDFAVVAFDWRGQGGSQRLLRDPLKGHVDGFELYQQDLDAAHALADRENLPRPRCAVAHSMGSHVLIHAFAQGDTRFDRAVLVAPMVDLVGVGPPRLARGLAMTLNAVALGGAYVPGGTKGLVPKTGFEGNRLTSDPQRFQRMVDLMKAGPHLCIGDPTIAWVHAAFRSMDEMRGEQFGAASRVPSLMLTAGADRMVSSPAAAALAERLRGCQCVEVPGARHEILMESDAIRGMAMAAIDAFIPGTGS